MARPTPHEALAAWGTAVASLEAAEYVRQANMRAAIATAAAVGVSYSPTPLRAGARARRPSREAVASARVALNEARSNYLTGQDARLAKAAARAADSAYTAVADAYEPGGADLFHLLTPGGRGCCRPRLLTMVASGSLITL